MTPAFCTDSNLRGVLTLTSVPYVHAENHAIWKCSREMVTWPCTSSRDLVLYHVTLLYYTLPSVQLGSSWFYYTNNHIGKLTKRSLCVSLDQCLCEIHLQQNMYFLRYSACFSLSYPLFVFMPHVKIKVCAVRIGTAESGTLVQPTVRAIGWTSGLDWRSCDIRTVGDGMQ